VHRGDRLVGFALDWHKPHPRPAHPLADRLGIGRVSLVAPHIGLGIGRRQQPHIMPQRLQLPAPVMRRTARLNPDQTARQLGEKRHDLAPCQLPAQHRLARRINPMHLKNSLGNVQSDRRNLFHGWSPWLELHAQLGTSMPFGGHPPHQARELS
jgi:hypothetical protein